MAMIVKSMWMSAATGEPLPSASEEFEYELLDTGVFDDDRYFDVFVEYAKAAPDDVLIRITVHNRGPEPARLRVLPTLWFRNTWSWGEDEPKPSLGEAQPGAIQARHHTLGDYCSIATEARSCCSRRTNQIGSIYGVSRIAPPTSKMRSTPT
jgi:hypothetical protein